MNVMRGTLLPKRPDGERQSPADHPEEDDSFAHNSADNPSIQHGLSEETHGVKLRRIIEMVKGCEVKMALAFI
jgi:hypothetical protein